MHVLFFLPLFLILFSPPLPIPSQSPLFRCVNEYVWNVVDNQSQAGYSPCRESEPRRLMDKQNAFCLTIYKLCLYLLEFKNSEVFVHS